LDETALAAAQQLSGQDERDQQLTAAFEKLADIPIIDRERAWR